MRSLILSTVLLAFAAPALAQDMNSTNTVGGDYGMLAIQDNLRKTELDAKDPAVDPNKPKPHYRLQYGKKVHSSQSGKQRYGNHD